MPELAIKQTPIPGLLVITLDIRGDNRGWFKENWQRQKMVDLGLPDFAPVQHNMSFNNRVGATRGIHAEPWDKLVSLATGRIFGAWVDLRRGDGFGRCFTMEMGPETAVLCHAELGTLSRPCRSRPPIPTWSMITGTRQRRSPTPSSTSPTKRWRSNGRSHSIRLTSPRQTRHIHDPPSITSGIEADLDHRGWRPARGRALINAIPGAVAITRATLDLTSPDSVMGFDFRPYGVVINAAAYTAVDTAETKDGRREAWAVNVGGVAALVEAARRHRFIVVHVSSDYVFDGTQVLHTETEPFSPLAVYGQTKAAGDTFVASLPTHYVVRTSWLIGDGHNFVRLMASLADRGVSPEVVNDQFGRLTSQERLLGRSCISCRSRRLMGPTTSATPASP